MEEIVPVLNDDIIDSLQTEQNQLTPEEVDQVTSHRTQAHSKHFAWMCVLSFPSAVVM